MPPAKQRKLVVFPSDPLATYLRKGEIKERYFNPDNFFSEVHVIDASPKELTAAEHKYVQLMAGNAKLVVHCLKTNGKMEIIRSKRRCIEMVRSIRPDCIRAYGVYHEGYLASRCAKELDIPFVLSIHGNYNHHKWLLLRKENFFQGLLHVGFLAMFRKSIIKEADEIIYVYRQAQGTISGVRVPASRQHFIYNKVYPKPMPRVRKPSEFTIIYVGNFFKVKNQQFLLKVIEPLDVHLVLIGKGYNRPAIMRQVHDNTSLRGKVEFIEAVPNSELANHYAKAHCFMSATRIEEISIPVIEAMSMGLPIIHRKPFSGEAKDPLFDAFYLVDDDVDSFRKAIDYMHDAKHLKEYSRKSLAAFRRVNGTIMESKERAVYQRLLRETK